MAMIWSNAICNDKPLEVSEEEEKHYAWGHGVVCCGECTTIVEARESWMQVYGESSKA
jgi:hypothetical protein